MKITLNLSPPASMRDRYALAWAIPAIVLGLAVLVLLGRATLKEYRGYRASRADLAEVQSRSMDLRQKEDSLRRKLEDPAYRQLLQQAKFVNTIIDDKKVSLAALSARVAGLLPADAQLTGLSLMSPKKPGDDYTVRLGINARGEDAIETFINDLEDSADFKDVSIINQGFQEDTSQGEETDVTCTARYLPGAAEEAEASGPPQPPGPHKPKAKGQEATAKDKITKGKNTKGKSPAPKPESAKSAK